MNDSTGDPVTEIADKVCLENSRISISFLPGAGGNISSITDLKTGRDWLWQNPHIPISNNRHGADYGRYLDSGGWDEILLSIAACDIELGKNIRIEIPDHGDLVRQSWSTQIHEDANGQALCRMAVSGSTLDYRFSRVAQLQDELPKASFQYSLSNNEDFAWPFYWCPHMLLDAQPELEIQLPEGLPLHFDGASDQKLASWPQTKTEDGRLLDLASSFTAANNSFARKVFVRTPSTGIVAAAIAETKERLTMTVDPDVLPWIGIWINNRGWSGCGSPPYLNLGLEPSTTDHDCVAEAIRNDAIDWIKPHETREWSVTVELDS